MKLLFTFAICLLAFSLAKGQDPTFAHSYYSPVYLNPALTGANDGLRLNMNSKYQWGRVPGKLSTNFISVDIAEPCYSVGLGVNALYDVEGEGFLSTTRIGFTGAWSRPVIRQKLDMAAGFGINHGRKHVDWSKLTFSDQLDPAQGVVRQSGAIAPYSGHSYLDIDGGLSFRLLSTINKRDVLTNFGIAVHHINRPDDAILGTARLPARYTLHAGSIIPTGKKWRTKGSFLFPYAVYNWQDLTDGMYAVQREITLGILSYNKPIVAGIIYHNGRLPLMPENVNQLGLLVGYQQPFDASAVSYQINYSYDFTLSGLGFSTTGTHELSVVFFFDGVSMFCGSGRANINGGGGGANGAGRCFRNRRNGYMPQF